MKTKLFLFIALVAITLVGCKTEEPELKTFVIDPLATVNIKPAGGTVMKVKGENSIEHLSALEIVKQTDVLRFVDTLGVVWSRGFDVLQRDTVSAIPMLKMWGTDILYYEQKTDGSFTDKLVLATDFLEAKNCLLLDMIDGDLVDTLAYIPDSVLRKAEIKIKALFAAKDYDSIYTIFNNAYTFIPITGAEYRALNQ